MDNEITLVGGDLRSHWAAWYLRRQGCSVITCGVPEEPEQTLTLLSKTVILPFPSFQGELIRGSSAIPVRELLNSVREGSRIFGGRLEPWADAFGKRGAHCCELYGSEPLTTANASLTAEGAISLAMEQLPITVQNAECLVIGFGRIGKLLARKLLALGARVWVSARSAGDRAMAEEWGCGSEETGVYGRDLSNYDLILNTVPQRILTAAQLARLRPDCLLVELASAPGGFSSELCRNLGINCLAAPGLPGKYAPKTAGILYARSILEFLEGKEEP